MVRLMLKNLVMFALGFGGLNAGGFSVGVTGGFNWQTLNYQQVNFVPGWDWGSHGGVTIDYVIPILHHRVRIGLETGIMSERARYRWSYPIYFYISGMTLDDQDIPVMAKIEFPLNRLLDAGIGAGWSLIRHTSYSIAGELWSFPKNDNGIIFKAGAGLRLARRIRFIPEISYRINMNSDNFTTAFERYRGFYRERALSIDLGLSYGR